MEYNFSSLQHKNVLITGGSGAIGIAIARGFQSCGAKVYLWGHRELPEIASEFQNYQIVELTDISNIKEAFQKVVEKAGSMDILVNCAGFTFGQASEDYPVELWEKTLSINLTAPFVLCQLAAKEMMKKKSGSIVNITSIGAELGFPNNPAYGASKAGLKQLTKAFACDWSKHGIRVNNIGPGYTHTKMTNGSWNDEQMKEERTKRTMVGAWAEPEDIVGGVLFLASDLSCYITGQDLYIDGGWCAKGL